MSSDYIPRLRAELLRAGASRQTHRRRLRTTRKLRPLALATAAALVLAALVLLVPGDRSDERPVAATERFSYRTAAGDSERAKQIVRTRLEAAGIRPAIVSASSGGLTIAVPPAARARVDALLQPGELAIYDWEASVLGPDGRPAPQDPAVTGGADAGHSTATTKAQARERGADARIVEAQQGNGWFALGGAPALTNADVASARVASDPTTREPIVALELTPQGQIAFRELTRTLVQRGADNALGGDPIQTSQHLAIVVDDRLMSLPFVNWQMSPDGIDGANGVQISAGLTPETARQLAALLSAGPLPAP